ncbi:MAG: tol-pal system-associated acyl-CoA thioesterase [Alphaproteobacteria bacterium]|nr:tol-pal system-associated acyl-CoA thioesterase [Alphaproteobacteria bacterium]
MTEPHRFAVRIHWEDTDAAGIVYYANYLRFIERARSDLVGERGVDQAALLADGGVVFPVRRCEIDYLQPASLDDRLEVRTTLRKLGGASLNMDQDIYRGEEKLIQAKVRLACIDGTGRPRRLPDQVRTALTRIVIHTVLPDVRN